MYCVLTVKGKHCKKKKRGNRTFSRFEFTKGEKKNLFGKGKMKYEDLILIDWASSEITINSLYLIQLADNELIARTRASHLNALE